MDETDCWSAVAILLLFGIAIAFTVWGLSSLPGVESITYTVGN